MSADREWWSTFFSGLMLESWRRIVTEEQTRAEADFLARALGLERGSRVLDVPCGEGRRSLELASRGCRPTGVDLTAESIRNAEAKARERGLRAVFEEREMRDLPWSAEFDAAFTFGGSFGYLDDEGNARFLKAIGRALKAGGRFALEAGIVAEALLPTFQPRSWHQSLPRSDIVARRTGCGKSARPGL